ncbi:MAG: hypothetical protein SVE93_04830 [Candidatus Thermoplasmatota archaeon]|nr:hypothetical protein [Candidatus Thermoplasmatota archaeon]
MMDDIKNILSSKIDPSLIERFLKHYRELKQKFFLGQYEPSQLNSAKFVEVAFRILEYITKGNYTPFDKDVQINSLMGYLEKLPKDKHPDSIRIHIPKILKVIYDIRSKRGVVHAGEVNPNLMDATFVVSSCDWIMAEFVRLYYNVDSTKAQKIIDSFVERKVPIIEEFGEDVKILDPNLTVADKILLILYKKHPDYVLTSDLKRWVKTKSSTHITTVLRQLDNDARIYRKGKESMITRKGIDYVEKKLSTEV